MTVNNNAGKTGPSTVHDNIPQGGPPPMWGAPTPSELKAAKEDFKTGSKGRKVNF